MEKLIQFFFPARCSFCGRVGVDPCNECRKFIKFIQGKTCEKCGVPVGDFILNLCPSCQRENFSFEKVFPVFYYDGVVRRGIHLFKYRGFCQNAITFSNLMVDKVKSGNIKFDIVIPVPISYERYLKRGYNHSYLLAKNISKILKIPLLDALKRTYFTEPFYNLSRQERKREIKDKIVVKNGYEKYIKEKTILLVDDIFTTGATANECSKVLLKSGASRVYVSVLAITKPSGRLK
ncbi:ComF family protein [Caldicellulosiruptor morganii]|uniref:ComF family protein n=1 Tax=Caldicellulosiruptor morganii TaxID=1387555 RepID=A0ABY7BJT8_9FIRM|nr:ComF family protein [Caldicellulosiruptor morganii]WAM33064.1 ComF family protein [Caldicellulosiruptor morganii]